VVQSGSAAYRDLRPHHEAIALFTAHVTITPSKQRRISPLIAVNTGGEFILHGAGKQPSKVTAKNAAMGITIRSKTIEAAMQPQFPIRSSEDAMFALLR
jgi:hypothetical protein